MSMTWKEKTDRLIQESKTYDALNLMKSFCELFGDKDNYFKVCDSLIDIDKREIRLQKFTPIKKYFKRKIKYLESIINLCSEITNSESKFLNKIIDYSVLYENYNSQFNNSLFSPQDVQNILFYEIDFSSLEKKKPINVSGFMGELSANTDFKNIVFGRAGIGKTTELLNLAINKFPVEKTSVTKGVVPIFVKLRTFHSSSNEWIEIINHIYSSYSFDISMKDFKESFISEIHIPNRFMFIFDGLNELESNYSKYGIDSIVNFINVFPHHYYVISSRNNSIDLSLLKGLSSYLKYFEILEWKRDQCELYFSSNNLLAQYQSLNENIKEKCQIPFIANLVVNVLKNINNSNLQSIPTRLNNIGKIYREYIINRLGLDQVDNIYDNLNFLSELAYKMNNEKESLIITYEQLQNLLINSFNENRLKSCVQSGILSHPNNKNLLSTRYFDSTLFEFSHQSFQEFFTAFYLRNKISENINLLVGKLNNSYWQDVPIYLVGLIEHPEKLINVLISKNKGMHWLIAAECISSAKLEESKRQILINEFIKDSLMHSIQKPKMHKDAIEIVKALGNYAVLILLSCLDNRDELYTIRALERDENNKIKEDSEKKWRIYGRVVYILGELKSEDFITKIKELDLSKIQDLHLLYHIVIAVYTVNTKDAFELLQKDILINHEDPLVRTFSLLGKEKLKNDKQLENEKDNLVPQLEKNLYLNEENDFALIAHSAEALGLLGKVEAIESLKSLLLRAQRAEPQSSSIKALLYIANSQRDHKNKIIKILLDAVERTNIVKNDWGMKFKRTFLMQNLDLISMERIDNLLKRLNVLINNDLNRKKIDFIKDLKKKKQHDDAE